MSQRLLSTLFAMALTTAAACGDGSTSSVSGCESNADCPTNYVCEAGSCNLVGAPIGDGDEVGGDGDGDVGPGDAGDAGDAGDGGDGAYEDLQSPVVDILSPEPYRVVGRVLSISAMVTDDFGLDPETVVAYVGPEFASTPDLIVPLEQVEEGGAFEAVVEVDLPFLAFPYLEVVAFDKAGNRGEAAHSFALDTTAPLVSLESPPVQVWRDADGVTQCSRAFLPLGDPADEPYLLRHGAVFTRATTGLVFVPRARLRDRCNDVGQPVGVYAGVLNSATKLLFHKRGNVTDETDLVVGDGTVGSRCVGLNPAIRQDEATPAPGQALVQDMVEIPPSGDPDFSGFDGGEACTDPGGDSEPPEAICRFAPSSLTYWLHIPESDRGAIYTINDYDPDELLTCRGAPFDTSNLPGDGIYCATVITEDAVGNSAAANPIAFCLDRDDSGDCATFAGVADDVATRCTDGCSSPEYPTGEVIFLE